MAGNAEQTWAVVDVRRVGDRPVVDYGAVPGYGPVFNAGAVFHDDRFHLFARGVRDAYRRNKGSGARFLDYVSDILVFTSEDGESYVFQQVLAEATLTGTYAYEDPRVHLVQSGGVDHFVMSYTNLPPPETHEFWRIGIDVLTYAEGRFSLGGGRIVGPPGDPDKDGIVFNLSDGRVALIHRVYPNMQLAVFDTLEELLDPPDGYWQRHMEELDRHTIIRPADTALGVGAGAPPVVTDDGLLLLFHERNGHEVYCTRAALLDHATGQVKAMLEDPIMCPQLPWERQGDVNNVVFVQGAIPRRDGTIYMTYGAADRAVGAATVSTDELLRALRAA
jgi:predicted GH43/DUF377 family glycosyl hydrolase